MRAGGGSPAGLRADARDNRDRIIAVARKALTTSGDASLNSIAKSAGVGPGTLYRHFPTREALVLAVYRHDVRELVDAAPALLEQHPPLEALRLWCDRLASIGRIKHCLAGVLHTATPADLRGEGYQPVIAAITALLSACQDAGVLRPDLGADDFLLLMSFMWRLDSHDDAWEQRATKMLDLVIGGLLPPARVEPAPESVRGR